MKKWLEDATLTSGSCYYYFFRHFISRSVRSRSFPAAANGGDGTDEFVFVFDMEIGDDDAADAGPAAATRILLGGSGGRTFQSRRKPSARSSSKKAGGDLTTFTLESVPAGSREAAAIPSTSGAAQNDL